ncbi:MAG: hypothetical protein FWH55_08435 [Oscillospiraceae bacterium]|nr:hypothetical protein [Oscillospiraceae bacterium]
MAGTEQAQVECAGAGGMCKRRWNVQAQAECACIGTDAGARRQTIEGSSGFAWKS